MTKYDTLAQWLAHCERIHPQTIDMGLERVAQVYQRLGVRFECPVFTVAGTNGKGSTCALLESILQAAGWKTGVYTSPHLVNFEERCRLMGDVVAPEALLQHFEAVEVARQNVSLTYFEFTTLAILRCLSLANLDAVVLEVGLGGRLDAVNVVDTDCAIITSIDLDHMDYLGPDRESIGFEKAGIMRAGRPVIVSDPQPPASIATEAARQGADLWLLGRDFHYAAQQNDQGRWQQWSWTGRAKKFGGLAYPALRGTNQLLNASGVLAALEALHHQLPITAQAVRLGLSQVNLPGRLQILTGQPTVVLDVAHNPHAVAALAVNLDQMGFFPKTTAVFGAMSDKDLRGVIAKINPLIDVWHVCDLPTPRAIPAHELKSLIESISRSPVFIHQSPPQALDEAIKNSAPTDRIVVFGSFFTVGGVLANGLPDLSGQHLASSPTIH